MKIRGVVNKVTDLPKFVASFLSQNKPDPSSFVPTPNARVSIQTDFPFGFVTLDKFDYWVGSVFTPTAVHAGVDSHGRFAIDSNLLSALPPTTSAYILVELRGSVTLPTFLIDGPDLTFPGLMPVYRSSTFTLDEVPDKPVQIFIAAVPAPPGMEITQQQVSAELSTARQALGLDTLTGVLESGAISGQAEKSGVRVTFWITLVPDALHSLDRFILPSVVASNVDHPWYLEACVDEDEVRRQLREQVHSIEKDLNDRIFTALIPQLAATTNSNVDLAQALFDRFMTLTMSQLHFPVSTHKGKSVRKIVPDLSLGFPRNPFA